MLYRVPSYATKNKFHSTEDGRKEVGGRGRRLWECGRIRTGRMGTAQPALKREGRACERRPLRSPSLCGFRGVSKGEEKVVNCGTWWPFCKARPKVRELHPANGPSTLPVFVLSMKSLIWAPPSQRNYGRILCSPRSC